MFIIVRNDAEVLAALDPFAPMAWVWIDYALSVATDHRYAVPFETRHGAETCAAMNGAQVHTIGDWNNATERSREVSSGCVCGHGSGPGLASAGSRRAGEGAGRGGPERGLSARVHGARADSRRSGGGPYLSHFRVVVNKFAN